jgi:hypothetical protein
MNKHSCNPNKERKALRVSEKNNCAGLRRDLVHLQGALKVAYRDMRPSGGSNYGWSISTTSVPSGISNVNNLSLGSLPNW